MNRGQAAGESDTHHSTCFWSQDSEAPEGEQRPEGGETQGGLPRVVYSVVSSAPHSGLRAHRVASRPPGRPLRWSVSSPPPKRAPRRRTLGRLRPASCRGWASGARLAGSAPANSPARCEAREFMPNDEPVARDRRAPAA